MAKPSRSLWLTKSGKYVIGDGTFENNFVFARANLGLAGVYSPTSLAHRTAALTEYIDGLAAEGWNPAILTAHKNALTAAPSQGYRRASGEYKIGTFTRYKRLKSFMAALGTGSFSTMALGDTAFKKFLSDCDVTPGMEVATTELPGPGLATIWIRDNNAWNGSVIPWDMELLTGFLNSRIAGKSTGTWYSFRIDTRGTPLVGLRHICYTRSNYNTATAHVSLWDGTTVGNGAPPADGALLGYGEASPYVADLLYGSDGTKWSGAGLSNLEASAIIKSQADLCDFENMWLPLGYGRMVSSAHRSVTWSPGDGVVGVSPRLSVTMDTVAVKQMYRDRAAAEPSLGPVAEALDSLPASVEVVFGRMGKWEGKLEDTKLYKAFSEADEDLRATRLNPSEAKSPTFGDIEKRAVAWRSKWGYERNVLVIPHSSGGVVEDVVPVRVLVEESGTSWTCSPTIPGEPSADFSEIIAALELALELAPGLVTVTGTAPALAKAAANAVNALDGVSLRLTGVSASGHRMGYAGETNETVRPWMSGYYLFDEPIDLFKSVSMSAPEATFAPFAWNWEDLAKVFCSHAVLARATVAGLTGKAV